MNNTNILELLTKKQYNEINFIINNLNDDGVKQVLKTIDNNMIYEILLVVDYKTQKRILENLDYLCINNLLTTETIIQMIDDKKFIFFKKIIENINPIDIAEAFENINDIYLLKAFRLLPKDLASDVFIEMNNNQKESLISKLNDTEIKEVIDDLFLDDTVDFVEEMPTNVVKKILAHSSNETRKYINEFLKYPVDSAGSIMTIEYVSLHANMFIKDAIEIIRKKAINSETIYTCYVTDNTNKLIGVISIKDLLINDDKTIINDIMHHNVIYVHTNDDKELVAKIISKYDFLAIPVVDSENRMVGIVTFDDAIDVLQEETEEDISKMAAIVPYEKTYLEMKPIEIWKNRVPWLLVLLISATFTGLIITSFEQQLNAISTLLFACVPMMMDTGGNSGQQASVTIIRGMATGELKLKDSMKILWKELRVAILVGLTLSLSCFIKLLLIDKLIFNQPYTYMLCIVISLALFITILLAKVVGALLPLLAKACKLDPAVVASPFITTIVDAVSLIVYCLLAINLL